MRIAKNVEAPKAIGTSLEPSLDNNAELTIEMMNEGWNAMKSSTFQHQMYIMPPTQSYDLIAHTTVEPADNNPPLYWKLHNAGS